MPPPRGTPNVLEGPGDYDVTSTVHSDTYPAIDPTNVNLAGKAIFVTGGSKGFGRAMVLSFVKAGASYIAAGARSDMSQLGRDVIAAAESARRPIPKFLPVKLEVTDEKSVDIAANIVKAEFGRCDILVNNAGILGCLKPIAESDPAEWWRIFEVNVRGTYLTSRAFIPLLLDSDNGQKTVINVSSVGAHLVNPVTSAYQTSKLALLRISQFIDQEYASQGLLSICIHPGNSPTEIIGDPKEVPGHLLNVMTDTPELCGDTVVYLASEKRDWLSGRYINVTWDMPELIAQRDEIAAGDKLKIRLVY